MAGPLAAVADSALIAATRSALAMLPAVPPACEQRDFSPWNVLVTAGGELAVLDWESGEPHGVPALDLIYFLTYLAACRQGPPTRDRLLAADRTVRDASTPIGRASQEALDQYLRATGTASSSVDALRLVCWLVHAEAEYRRPEGRTAVDGALDSDSPFVALWEQSARVSAGVAA